MEWMRIKKQLIDFLCKEVKLAGFEKVTVGISGGLDSAVVAVLCKEAFGDNMKGILMPSQYSSQSSLDDAKELCQKFNIDYEIISIKPMVEAYFESKESTLLRVGNFSARMRMSVLYDVSARDKSLVVGTSNKSEILLGYGTIYGDTACAINPIGEIFKSDEFDFARYLDIPKSIIDKKPSADLWEGQSDETDIGYSYMDIDKVLKKLVLDKMSIDKIVEDVKDKEMVFSIIKRVESNSFKNKLPKVAKYN